MINKLRKIFTVSVMMMTVLSMSVVVVPQVGATASAGDLIKMDGLSSVYYLGDDSKRYVFPNETTYFSWYSDFSGVVTVSQSELESYPLGSNVTMRPGTKLVKITTSPVVYAVESGGSLRAIPDEATAKALYGDNWSQRVVDVPDAFFTNYTISDEDLTEDEYPEGSLIKASDSADVYYVNADGEVQKVASEAALLANRFSYDNVITVDDDYSFPSEGDDITGSLDDVVDTSQGAVETPGISADAGTGLTVALASDTPASDSLPTGASLVPFTKVNFTASSDGDVTVKNLVVTRTGIGSASDFAGVWLYDVDGNRLTSSRTVSSSSNTATFSGVNFVVDAGTTEAIVVMATVTGTSGNDGFSIDEASDVTTDGASVSGSFPVAGNQMSLSSVNAGALTYSLQSVAKSSVKVGDTQEEVAKIKITETLSNEDIVLSSITFTNDGAADANDLENFKLYQSTTLVAELASIDSDRVRMVLNEPMTIKKGSSKIFTLKADIKGGVSSTAIQYDIDDLTDVVAIGATYEFGVSVTAGGSVQTVAVEAGELTIEIDGPAAYEVVADAEDIVLANMTMNTGDDGDIEVKTMYAYIDCTDSDSGAGNLQTGLENVQLVDVTNDNYYDVSSDDGSADDDYYFKVTNFTISSGESEWRLETDFNDSYFANGDICKFVLHADEDTSTGSGSSGKEGIEAENQDGKAVNDIKPGADIDGNNVTVATASLAVASDTLSAGTAVAKTKDVKLVQFTAEAGTSEDVKVTQIATELTTGDYADASNFSLYVEGEAEALETGVSAVDATPDTVTFTDLKNGGYTITAGQTAIFYITADIATSGLSSSMKLSVSASGVTAEDSDGDSMTNITGLGSALAGRTVTLTTKGSIEFTVDNDSPNDANILLSGSTDNEVLKVKADASNEDVVLKTLKFRNLGATNSTATQASFDGQTGDAVTYTANAYGTSGNSLDVNVVVASSDNGGDAATCTVTKAGNVITATIDNDDDTAGGGGDAEDVSMTGLVNCLNSASSATVAGTVTAGNVGDGNISCVITNDVTDYITVTGGAATIAIDEGPSDLAGGVGYGTPNEAYVKAQGTLTIDTAATDGDTFTIGSDTYEIDTLAASNGVIAGNIEVQLAADTAAGTQTAIVTAINSNSAVATIASFSANAAVITAQAYGTAGNSIATTETFTAGTNVFDAATLGTTTAGVDRTDTDDSIAKVSLYQNDTWVAEKTVVTSTGYIEFSNLDTLTTPVVVEKDTDSVFTLKVDAAGIGSGADDTATSGDTIKMTLEGNYYVEARGYSSNNDLTASDITVTSVESESFSIYGSKVIATASESQPSTLSSGQKEVLKVTLTPSSNDSKVAQLTGMNMTIDLTDNSGSDLGIQDSGSTYAIEVYSGSTRVGYYSSTSLDNASGLKTLTVTADNISSSGETYVVKVNAVGVAADDSITATIAINDGAGGDDITWTDYSGASSIQWVKLSEGSSTTSITNTISK